MTPPSTDYKTDPRSSIVDALSTMVVNGTQVKLYLLVTGNYWAFTLSDGALRMWDILHFHGLGYSPLEIALLFLFYEFFGVLTNNEQSSQNSRRCFQRAALSIPPCTAT